METYAGTNKAEEWRIHVKDFFEKNTDDYKVINPTDYYQYGKNYHKTDKEVFRFDLRKVSNSDIVLVNLNDIRKSIGTCIEVYEAYKNNIPVVGFLNDELPVEEMIKLIHPWIYCCVDRIETGKESLNKAINYIIDYYG
jgi:nucleoside 2-deoxyribosyltransferase